MISIALLLILLCQSGIVYSLGEAVVQTTCPQQLHYFYEQSGLSATTFPMLRPITFTQGISGGYTYVDATIDFQGVARTYQANLTGSSPVVYVSAFSLDVPWCVFNTSITCSGRTLYGVGKIDGCLIVDYDLGGDTQIAGRLWIYVDQTGSCAGQAPKIRFFNVTLDNSTTTATYTYDTLGIVSPYINLNLKSALDFYRNSTCAYSDGALVDAITQKQFVCNDYPMICALQRSNALGSPPVVPIPQYACLGNLTPTSATTPIMVWWISSYDRPGSIAGSFYLTFCQASDQLCRTVFEQACRSGSPVYPLHSLLPGTRRQFFSPYTDFDQTIVIFYSGFAVSFQPRYTQAPFDPVVRVIPCICEFSVDCHANGVVINDTFTVSSYITPINTPPIADPGSAAIMTQGIPTFLMNATASYDPNLLPGFFSIYWKLYTKPAGSPAVSIPSPQSPEFLLDASLFKPGLYQFVLYASDSQSITFSIFNITVIYNIVYLSINISKQVQFIPYAGASPTAEASCPTFGNYPSPCIPIDASGTTATNPNATLTFLWTQTIGYKTPIPYLCDITGVQYTAGMINYTTNILCIIPPNIGLYGYNLIVSDGVANFSQSVLFFVVPNYITPQGPELVLPNYTRAPPRTLTLPPRTIFTWPNFTSNLTPRAPWASPPTTPPVVIPPLIPDHGPPTRDQLIVLVTAMIAAFFALLLFFAYYIIRSPSDDYSCHDQYVIDTDTY